MKIQYARFLESVNLSNKQALHAVSREFEIAILPRIGCMQLTAIGGKQAGSVVVVPMSNVLYFTAEDASPGEEAKPEAEEAKALGSKPTKTKPGGTKPTKATVPAEPE